jgi:hypothetical protein
MKRIQFFVDDLKYEEIMRNSHEKGLTIDNFARMALYTYITRYGTSQVRASQPSKDEKGSEVKTTLSINDIPIQDRME